MKKSIALLMALVCTLAFAGCKAVEQDTNTQAPEKQAQQPEPAPEQQPEGAAQVACASPTGGISP